MTTKTTDLSRLLNRDISRLGEMPDDELTRLCVMLERAFTHAIIERELRDQEGVSQPSLAVVSG
jgi:hypothetical protein